MFPLDRIGEVVRERPINITKAKINLDNDIDLLQELIDIFFEQYPAQLQALQTAVEKRDAVNVRYMGHQIKGSLRNFAAEGGCDAAYALEKAGEDNDFASIQEKINTLEREVAALKRYYYGGQWRKDVEGRPE